MSGPRASPFSLMLAVALSHAACVMCASCTPDLSSITNGCYIHSSGSPGSCWEGLVPTAGSCQTHVHDTRLPSGVCAEYSSHGGKGSEISVHMGLIEQPQEGPCRTPCSFIWGLPLMSFSPHFSTENAADIAWFHCREIPEQSRRPKAETWLPGGQGRKRNGCVAK